METTQVDITYQGYLDFLEITDWPSKEIYKFEFGHWIRENVNLELESTITLKQKAIESQKIQYSESSYRGVQFVINSARVKKSRFFDKEDASIILKLYKGDKINEELFSQRNMSYTGLTSWLGTMIPHQFCPCPVADFGKAFKYLYADDIVPGGGLDFFKYNQDKCEQLKQYIKLREAPGIYLSRINAYRITKGLGTFKSFGEVDYNWIVEDFLLYVHRIVLGLFDTSYLSLSPNFLKTASLPAVERAVMQINRIKRNSQIVVDLKQKYNCECQVCGKSARINPTQFVEGAHLKPLGHPHNGQDAVDNLLILCPNHHKLLDIGTWTISGDGRHLPLDKPIKFIAGHSLNSANLKYHYNEVYKK